LIQLEELKLQLGQAGKDVDRYKNKHDEMFQSVSGLN
jgi:Ni,Fe-hydrogenase III large subunit